MGILMDITPKRCLFDRSMVYTVYKVRHDFSLRAFLFADAEPPPPPPECPPYPTFAQPREYGSL